MAYLIACILVVIGAAKVLQWMVLALWYVWILVQNHRQGP